MSSPQQNTAALPPLPSLPRRTSSRGARLHLPQSQAEPPIPPRLVGSPLLNNLLSPGSKQTAQGDRAHQEAWLDGDEFSTHRTRLGSAQVPDIARGNPRYTSPPPPPWSLTQTMACVLHSLLLWALS